MTDETIAARTLGHPMTDRVAGAGRRVTEGAAVVCSFEFGDKATAPGSAAGRKSDGAAPI